MTMADAYCCLGHLSLQGTIQASRNFERFEGYAIGTGTQKIKQTKKSCNCKQTWKEIFGILYVGFIK
jgi:hypothetical protein